VKAGAWLPAFHFHLVVVDGLFEGVENDTDPSPPSPNIHLRFHEATTLSPQLLEDLQHTVRKRVLRHCRRHGLLEPHEAEGMLSWEHGGGFSLDASVYIEATDRTGLERLIRYCARGPFALDRLHLVDGRSDQILYLLPGPDLAGRTALRLSALEFLDRLAKILPPPRIHRHRYHGVFAPNAPLRPLVTAQALVDNALAPQLPATDLPLALTPKASPPGPQVPQVSDTAPSRPSKWASRLARIYEVFPLVCPSCQTPLTFIAFLTDPEPIAQILAHIGEPCSPPLLHPARGPPQTELAMGIGRGEQDEAAQESFPDVVSKTARWTKLWGWLWLGGGALMVVVGVLALPAGAVNIIFGAVYLAIGWYFKGAGESLQAVVDTTGNDMGHLMTALEKLGLVFKTTMIITLVGIILGVAAAIIVSSALATMQG
jgi:hypothetical protein